MDKFDSMMNEVFGKKSATYTAEEIDAARARQKKYGGTLLENLAAVTGKGLEIHSVSTDAVKRIEDSITSLMGTKVPTAGSTGRDPEIPVVPQGTAGTASSGKGTATGSTGTSSGSTGAAGDPFSALNDQIRQNSSNLDAQIAELNAQLRNDFGFDMTSRGSAAAASYDGIGATDEVPEATAESFKGVEDELKTKIFGQDAFIKKLTVAFKRPYVLKEDEGHARNTVFIYGGEDTGRHASLQEMAAVLHSRGVLKTPEISRIDLSIYNAAGNDNVFLQDLYTALQSKSDILLFENYEACHISYLAYVSELFTTGSCRLSSRYVLQNGQLVNVSNSFASAAVSSFSAAGKYLVMISTKGLDGLANSLGAPFVNALGDTASTAALDAESFGRISEVKYAEMKSKVEKELRFVLTGEEEAVREAAVRATEKNAGLAGMLKFYVDLLKAIAGLRLEGDYETDAEVSLKLEDGRILGCVGGEETDLLGSLPAGYAGALDAVKAELDSIVGLTEIKKYVLSLEEYYSVQKKRREQGLKAGEVNKHMIFTGSPGTGKTTIARIISRYLKAIGVLTGGQLVEVTRADLVGRYVGHTAPLTMQVLTSAIGGVLFIDEAYSLYRGKDDTFGLEAIDTLVKGIEDNRDNLIVILAGYSREMEEFLTSNSGLKSRFPNIIDFPDYTGEELLAIAKITVKSKGYKLDDGAMDPLLAYFNAVQLIRPKTAGNGRLVRNKIEEAILNQSRRLAVETEADLSLLLAGDFDLTDIGEPDEMPEWDLSQVVADALSLGDAVSEDGESEAASEGGNKAENSEGNAEAQTAEDRGEA